MAYIDGVRRRNPGVPVIALDGGNVLGDPGIAGELRSRLLLETLAEGGYDAANVGPREAIRWAETQKLSGESGVPWVSANLRRSDGSTADGVEPYRLIEFPGLRVALVGLGFPGPDDPPPDPFDDPAEALSRALESLRGKADQVVVFGSLPIVRMARMATTHPELLAILSGQGQFETRDGPLVFGSTALATPGNRGRKLIDLRFSLKGPRPRILSYRLVKLDRSVEGDPRWEEKITEVLAAVRKVARAEALSASAPVEPSPYAGGDACAPCHEAETRIWETTSHARAFETLVKDGRDFDDQCVSCHVTGWERTGGFIDVIRTPGLRDVRCEACHGPGRAHVDDPSPGYGRIDSPERDCVVCHSAEQTDHFEFDTAWQRISH